jgi:hypothetical protein
MAMPGNRLAHVAQLTGTGLGQARDQAQEGRLAGPRTPEEPHDLALAQFEIHPLEHQQFRAVRLRKRLAHVVALQ